MIPVTTALQQQSFDFEGITEQEQKVTLAEVHKFLQTRDFDQDFLA
jgi:hypothetical protein